MGFEPGRRDESERRPGRLSEGLIRRRVSTSVFFVGSWGVVNLLVGFGGSIALARMLAPRDFGLVAIGATILMIATSLADGGLAGGLIRREKPPSREELEAALGLQLTFTAGLAAVVALVASFFGRPGAVVALMMVALPVAALPTPGRVVLSRELRFRAIATVEAAGMFAYYTWAVAGAAVGFGVWALASGLVVRAVVTTAGILAASGLGVVRPRYRGVRALRPVIAFGVRFQAVSLAGIGREQGLNAGVAAMAGVSTLGFWSLTRRVLELPVVMFEPLHRVSFPYLSHVLAGGRNPARLLERGVGVSATASGVVLVGLAVAAPELVPAVFGEQWSPVAPILQWVCAALLVAGPVSVMAVGYLYAAGVPGAVLRATLAHTVVLFAVTFPLLPVVGPTAIGIGSFAGAVVDCVIMSEATRRRSGARPLVVLVPVLAVTVVAGGLGFFVSRATGPGVAAGLAGSTAAGLAFVVLLAAVQRETLVETGRQLAAAVRNGLTREPQPSIPEDEDYAVEATAVTTP